MKIKKIKDWLLGNKPQFAAVIKSGDNMVMVKRLKDGLYFSQGFSGPNEIGDGILINQFNSDMIHVHYHHLSSNRGDVTNSIDEINNIHERYSCGEYVNAEINSK